MGIEKNCNLQDPTAFDVNCNLNLIQMIVYKIFGYKSLRTIPYLSPKNERNIEINKLALEVVPVLKSLNYCVNNNFTQDDSAPEWYRSIFTKRQDKDN